MTHRGGDVFMRALVSADRRKAELFVPKEFPREGVTPEAAAAALREAGVEITPQVQAAIEGVRAQAGAGDQHTRILVARATEPMPGRDGWVEWALPEPEPEPATDADAPVDFYERCNFPLVEAGRVLGRVHAPEPGREGRDVTGRPIPAKPPRPAPLWHDDSISREEDGRLVATCDGLLMRAGEVARVSRHLEIRGHVDFNTGNLDFAGDVVVRGGIRDRFEIRADGFVDVHGLVEACRVECGGDFLPRAGVAGRERGHIRVGGAVVARYLDGVGGEVEGDLEFGREAINCRLRVGGAVRSPRGAIIGGEIVAAGPVEVAALGSPAAVATTLKLGAAPALEAELARAEAEARELEIERLPLEMEARRLAARRGIPSPEDERRRNELRDTLEALDARLGAALARRDERREAFRERCRVHLKVSTRLCQNVVIVVGGRGYRVRRDLRGPLEVWRGSEGNVLIRFGTGPAQALAGVATPVLRAA